MNKNKFKNIFSIFPAGISGVGLGIAGLGNAWSSLLSSYFFKNYFIDYQILNLVSIIIQSFFILITIICFSIILIKIARHFNIFSNELKDPLISSYLPTESMCLACIAFYIGNISLYNVDILKYEVPIVNAGTIIANILILISLLTHLLLIIFFIKNVFIKHLFQKNQAYFSWLIPFCGIGLSCGFEPKLGFIIPNEFFQFFWYFAFISLVLLVPYTLYKNLYTKIDQDKVPSMAISFAAPYLVLNGWLSLSTETNYYSHESILIISLVILIFGILGFFIYYCSFFKTLNIEFNGGFAAYTFPTSISSLATIKFSDFIFNNYYNLSIHLFFSIMGFIFLIFSTLIIFYIFIRYSFLIKKLLKNYLAA